MDASEAIRRLPNFVDSLRKETDGVSTAAMDVMVRWRNLGRVGGQRCDSAAAFLSNMQPSLRSLESTARKALEIIETLQANPFGDK